MITECHVTTATDQRQQKDPTKRTQPDCSDWSDLVQQLDRELLPITWQRIIYDKISYSEGEVRACKCGANLSASLWQRSKSRFFQRCQPPAPSRRFRRHLRRESFPTSVCKSKRNSTGLNIICWAKITKASPWTGESRIQRSALGVSVIMRYINRRFTYLLTYLLTNNNCV